MSIIVHKLSIFFWSTQKNSKKIRFFHFFPYDLVAVFIKYCITTWRNKNGKNVVKKKLKKKRFSFLQTFFLKSFLDIYLCPISKIKKEFQKVQVFYFFLFFTVRWNGAARNGLFCNARNDPRTAREYLKVHHVWALQDEPPERHAMRWNDDDWRH